MITVGGNEFVAQVKGNQPNLLAAIESVAGSTNDYCLAESNECSRGRQERRTLKLWNDATTVEAVVLLGWQGVQSVYSIEHNGTRNGQPYNYLRWYISSAKLSVQDFLSVSRLHWQIENNCHRVKDVALAEDATSTEHHTANRVWALLRNFAINVFRLNGFKSIKYAIEHFANYVELLYELLKRT